MTGIVWLDILIALVIGVFIWRVSVALIRMLSTQPEEIDPTDVIDVDQDYVCTVCGAELTMKAVNVAEDKPPRHCREDMVTVWHP